MKLKEYLYRLVADQPVQLIDSEYDYSTICSVDYDKGVCVFANKTIIPKDVLELEVVKYSGTTYFPGDFVGEDEIDRYDPYEDWYGCVAFYIDGFKEAKAKHKWGEIVKKK